MQVTLQAPHCKPKVLENSPEHHQHELALAQAVRPKPLSIISIRWRWFLLSDPSPGLQTQAPQHHQHHLALAPAFRPKPLSPTSISWRWPRPSDPSPSASSASSRAGPGLQTQAPEPHQHALAPAFRPKPLSIISIISRWPRPSDPSP